MSILSQKPYSEFLLPKYNNLPTGKFVHLIVIRKTQSETIFRTEGGGEPLVREYVNISGKPDFHIVMSKRKQTAVERRTGRELLRTYGLLTNAEGVEDILNDSTRTFEGSVDSWVYGYAVGSGGAQKSRVITEDAFSILPAHFITDTRTFNATFDNGTMRHPETGDASTSLGSSEYVKPEAHFLDIETLKDITLDEFIYIMGNVLRSKRYGAISSRIGRMDNTVVGVVFADTEIFSTLELCKAVYKILNDQELDHPMDDMKIQDAVKKGVEELSKQVIGKLQIMTDKDLQTLHDEVNTIYKDSEGFIKRLAASYPKAS
jgi:CRISPR-associated protein Csc2